MLSQREEERRRWQNDRLPPKRPVLDHGYIQLVECWGSDESIIEAARMSTGKGFLRWDPGVCPECGGYAMNTPCKACEGTGKVRGDQQLLAFLHEKKHTTPFEMAGMIVEVQAPIMVFREWHRHRTQSYSEMSARYTPLPDVTYTPDVDRLLISSKTNKQAGVVKGAGELTEEVAEEFQKKLDGMWAEQQALYEWALQKGVPKELARVHLGVGRYSRMRASANLLNWLKFLTLRMDQAAQFEIRQYANALGDLVAENYPKTWALFLPSLENKA